MKSVRILLPFLFMTVLAVAPTSRTHAQIFDAIEEAIRQALIAADVAVQKTQTAVIEVQNTQKEIENQLSQLNLGQIGDWEGKIKDIYSDYFSELWKVKTIISYFRQITTIIAQQQQLVQQYKQAYAAVQQDKHFTASEVSYIYSVYTGIINESVKSVDQIITVLTSFSLQMSDADRMKLVGKASADIQQQTSDMGRFNSQTMQISLQRAQSETEVNNIMQLYGLQQ